MRRFCFSLYCVAICLTAMLWTSAARAVVNVNVGTINLLPNLPGQSFDLFVTGGDFVQGVDFKIQLGTGFGTPTAPGPDGPNITGVDLIASTIFATNNTGQQNQRSDPQYWFQGLTTDTIGGVAANGRLARITVDTTGFNFGSFPLLLTGTFDGATDFSELPIDIAANITNGSITIVPEPSTLLLASFGALALAVVRRRRNRVN